MSGQPYVYFMRPVGMAGPIKIGCSGNPPERMYPLTLWSPFPLEIVATIPGSFALERNIHDCFADAHSHHEWFLATPALLDLVRKLQCGVPIEEALDLSQRKGSMAARVGIKHSPERRLAHSYKLKLHHAAKRAAKATEGQRNCVPHEADVLVAHLSTRAPTDEERAYLDAIVAQPERHPSFFPALLRCPS